jgi:hypothetical protein
LFIILLLVNDRSPKVLTNARRIAAGGMNVMNNCG